MGKGFQSRKDFDFEAITKMPENFRWFRGFTENREANKERKDRGVTAERRANTRKGECCRERRKRRRLAAVFDQGYFSGVSPAAVR